MWIHFDIYSQQCDNIAGYFFSRVISVHLSAGASPFFPWLGQLSSLFLLFLISHFFASPAPGGPASGSPARYPQPRGFSVVGGLCSFLRLFLPESRRQVVGLALLRVFLQVAVIFFFSWRSLPLVSSSALFFSWLAR